MDPLCHTLTGAGLSASGMRRAGPLATATLVLAANAPDVDIVVYAFAGEYAALAFRRGITHGLPALLLWPFVVVRVVTAWDRILRRRRPQRPPLRPRPLLLAAFVGVLTHPILDWLNTYGMRWLAPFHGGWSYGDAVFIVDPWMWLGLGAAVYLSRSWPRAAEGAWAAGTALATLLVARSPFVPPAASWVWLAGLALVLVARLAWRPPEAGRTAVARRLVAAVAAYVAVAVALDAVGRREAVRAARRAGLEPVAAVMVAPLPADPLRGEVVVATPWAYHWGTLRWLDSPRVRFRGDSVSRLRLPLAPATLESTATPGPATLGRSVASGPGSDHPALEAARRLPRVRHFLAWSRFPFFDVEEQPDAWLVRVGDARYARIPGAGSLGGVTVRVPRPP